MKNSRLIKILKSFSRVELKEFERFLRSPFFNCPKFVLKLFLILKKLYPDFKEKNIDGESLFKKLYGDRKFNGLLMRRMISDLIRFSEEYLRYKNFSQNESFRNICLLNELSKRDLDSVLLLKYNSVVKKSDDAPLYDPDRLLQMFQVHTEMKNSRSKLRDDLMNISYTRSIEAISVLYLRILFSYINHTNTFPDAGKNASYISLSFFKNFDRAGFFKETEILDDNYSSYLRLINYCLLITENKNRKDIYDKLKYLIMNYPERFSPFERISCLAVMQRFCNHQNLKNNNQYLMESFEIQKLILNEKLFLENSQFLQLSFCRNFVIKCLSLAKKDELLKFIRQYGIYFSPEYKDAFINYCKALLKFEEGNFDRSLFYISGCDLENAIFRKDLKILKIKIFYELNYLDSLFSETDSFRHFIKSNLTINPDIKTKAKNFIGNISALSKLKDFHSAKDLNILYKKIENETKTSEKKWLLNKIIEINKKNGLKNFKPF